MQPEEKLAIVLEGLQEDRTVKEVCDKYDISRHTYYRWKGEMQQSACRFWEEQSPGRKGPNHFESKAEAERQVGKQQEEIEARDKKLKELRKKLEGTKLQRDFARFRLDLRDVKKKIFEIDEKQWILDQARRFQSGTLNEYVDLFEMSKSAYFDWVSRSEEGCLKDRSRAPKHMPFVTSIEAVEEVLRVHLDFPLWGGEKISDFLLKKQIAYISPGTAQKIKNMVNKQLDGLGYRLNVKTRYEALSPSAMWATDLMQFDWYGNTLYVALFHDDNSRFVVNWGVTTSATTEFVINLLDEAIDKYGAPEVVKSDNGPQFRNTFAGNLEERDIAHLPSPLYFPQYNGKLERLNRDIKGFAEELNHLDIENLIAGIGQAIYEHNYVRPHQGLDGITPAQRFNGLEEEIKDKMAAFKEEQKRTKRCPTPDASPEPNTTSPRGIVVSVRRDGETVLSVRSFSQIQLQKVLD